MQYDIDVDIEWKKFLSNYMFDTNMSWSHKKNILQTPKCTSIYISTKTMITYLNQKVNLEDIFWKIPIMPYWKATNGIIKKQIKLTSLCSAKVEEINKYLDNEIICSTKVISSINNPKSKIKFKQVQKVNIGVSKKELISYRSKEKGAFYNCIAFIFRILYKGEFKEVHVKVFNTGKLEIPGIQTDELLFITLDELMSVLKPLVKIPICFNKTNIETVLINSNFNCGYFINRDLLHSKLKIKYNMISIFDPCSYPGIQSKFYYNMKNKIQNGVCSCSKKCGKGGSGNGDGECIEVSFMIFRTGSILIVGHCDEFILNKVYEFLKIIFSDEFQDINEGLCCSLKKKRKSKNLKKREIIFDL